MPAPVIPFIPRRSDGTPTPGFRTGRGMGMGDMLPMSALQHPGAGGQAWQGPWLSMSQVGPQPPLQTAGQQFGDWVVSGPNVNQVTSGGGSFLTMPAYQAAIAPPPPPRPGVAGMGSPVGGEGGGSKIVWILGALGAAFLLMRR